MQIVPVEAMPDLMRNQCHALLRLEGYLVLGSNRIRTKSQNLC